MVLTEQQETTVYDMLSFEGEAGSAEVTKQDNIWDNANGQPINVASVRTTSPGPLQNSGLTPPPLNNSLLVRSSTGKVGAGKLMKVMAGDRIHTSVQYYYPTVGAQPPPRFVAHETAPTLTHSNENFLAFPMLYTHRKSYHDADRIYFFARFGVVVKCPLSTRRRLVPAYR